jgi:hypothetical protein
MNRQGLPILGALVIVMALAPPALAISLADVEALTVGSLLFSEFGFVSSGEPIPLSAQQIDVTPLTGSAGTGLRFDGPYRTGPNESFDTRIRFDATSLDPSVGLDRLTLSWDGAVSRPSKAGGTILTLVTDLDSPFGFPLGLAQVEAIGSGGGEPPPLSSTVEYAPVRRVGVENELFLSGGGGPCPTCDPGTVTASFFSVTLGQTRVAAAEPSTVVLVGVVLLGAGIVRLRLRAPASRAGL